MNSPPSKPPNPLPAISRLAPLTQTKVDGTPYSRRADVEAQILKMIATNPQDWSPDTLKTETLVHLIRWQVSRNDECAVLPMFEVIGKRIARIVGDYTGGFDSETAHAITEEISLDIAALVFASEPTRQSEFLEVSFRQAVQRRAINKVIPLKNRAIHVIGESQLGTHGDTGGEAGIIESHLDESPGPEEIAIEEESARKRPRLIQKALSAISDDRHREMMILHSQGWPLESTDPEKPTLSTRFKVSGRQIQNWIKTATEEMRAALGDEI